MSVQTIGLLGIVSLVVLMMLRVPVAVAMLVVGLVGYTAIDSLPNALQVLSGTPVQIATEYSFSVVPLFVLMSSFCARMGLSSRLYAASGAFFGAVRGSSAFATVGASAAFGAICGSSLATCATIGRIGIPEMRALGYRDTLISGSVAAGGTLGILIPPSIIMVIYALISQQSIAHLFAAGLIPGIILTVLYCVAIVATMLMDPTSAPHERVLNLRERLSALFGAWELVILFGITIGGIYAGFFTPTEAAAVGVFLALVIGVLRRSLKREEILASVVETAVTSSVLFFIVLGATFFAFFIVQARIPTMLIEWLNSAGFSALGVLLLIVVFYLIAGCFLDGVGMMLATVPVFFPVIVSFGYDPVWFGILIVLVVEVGLLTPPMGMNLFVIKSTAPDLKITDIYIGILPFLGALMLMIGILIAAPQVALWLPHVLYR